jgi:hypothetical protein
VREVAVADNPKDETPKQNLSDEIVQQVRAQIIAGGTGYGKPPKEHQFKKGERSPNPGGRPRSSPRDLSFSSQPTLGVARQIANKKIPVQDGGIAKEVSGYEVLISKIFTHGVKGNARYAGIMLDLIRTAEQAHAREVRERNEYWSTYQSVARQAIAEVRANGEAEPAVLPHPDDIIIDWENGPRFIGPFDKAELKQFQETQRLRDVLLMQDVLDQRSTIRLDGTPLKEPRGALLFAMVLDKGLPPRLRISDADIRTKQRPFERLTKRELLKTLRREWCKFGRDVPRGFVFPGRNVAVQHLDFLSQFIVKAKAGELDIDALAAGEFNAAARSFFEQHGIPIAGH